MNPRAAVTGASGFIGGAIVEAADRDLRVLVRDPHHSMRARWDVVVGDLADPEAIDRLLDGVETLIHAANYIGPDGSLAEAVNDEGTRSLVAAARRAGVRRIVYISTTGVYGSARQIAADETTPVAPTSATSSTRLRAEGRVVDAGGAVLRPHLVVGAGDTRVVPVLAAAIDKLGGYPEPSALTSVITVRDLAQQVWTLADAREVTGVVHADHGDPVRLGDLLGSILRAAGKQPFLSRVQAAAAREILAGAGLRPHQVAMLLEESTFTSRLAGVFQSRSAGLDDADYAWYRQILDG